jgi:hypothetical protein
VRIYKATYPAHPKKGQLIQITVETIPNATLDVEFEYCIGEGLRRTERQEYVSVDSEGVATVSWLVSRDITGSRFVGIWIDAYPPKRALYRESASHTWRNMPAATKYIFGFRIED